ncbi:MAG: 16S rRNA (cytidine(1402)-2'-O)-methyltransferase [Bacteroidetes bacterium]|nr:16S rRNA (cytidine(1402)-2'-O)-methyltransferase [Bacteroidota bacterium]
MSETIQAGCLYVVSTPIGNLDDITLRAIKVLGGVDLVAAEDTRKTKFLLDHLSISKPLISYYSHNEARRVPELISRLKEGKSVAVVTDAGTPGISDPAFLLIRSAIENDVRVIPVPGASAALAALVVSGLPTDRFVFEGFLPVKKGRKKKFEQLKEETRTIIIYESPFRVERTLEEIIEHFGERLVVAAREITKKFEEVVRGRASEVLAHFQQSNPKGEYVIVVEGNTNNPKAERE